MTRNVGSKIGFISQSHEYRKMYGMSPQRPEDMRISGVAEEVHYTEGPAAEGAGAGAPVSGAAGTGGAASNSSTLTSLGSICRPKKRPGGRLKPPP
jgi:hypothetical protein